MSKITIKTLMYNMFAFLACLTLSGPEALCASEQPAQPDEKAHREIDALLQRLPIESEHFRDYVNVLEDLLLYTQKSAYHRSLLCERLMLAGHHSVLLGLLSITNSTIKQQIYLNLKQTKLLPPIQNTQDYSEGKELLNTIDWSYLVGSGDQSLYDAPFNNNHLPVVWLTENKFIGEIAQADGSFTQQSKQLSYNGSDSIYLNFISAVRFSDWLVVASKPFNCAIFSAAYGSKHPFLSGQKFRDELKQTIEQNWMIYLVPDSQYYVWVPKKHLHRYLDILNTEELSLLKSPGQKLEHDDLVKLCPTWWIQQLPTVKKYHENDPKKIFRPRAHYKKSENKTVILDFLLAGHGLFGTSAIMAGIPLGTQTPEHNGLTSLLSYLNEHLSVGTVGIVSCKAGGSNKLLLQENANGLPLQYHYKLVLRSISDKSNFFPAYESFLMFQKYFTNAAQLETGQSSIEQLCKDFSKKIPHEIDPHGFAGLPQVLLPGTQAFTACTRPGEVFEATENILESKQPIELKNKQIALWHEADIQNKITVYPCAEAINDSAKGLPLIFGEASEQLPIIYPEFISMKRTQPILHFKHIIVADLPDQQPILTGILYFIRDAFLNSGHQASEMNIVIEKLEGRNAIPGELHADQLSATEHVILKDVFIKLKAENDPNKQPLLTFTMPGSTQVAGIPNVTFSMPGSTQAAGIPTVVSVGERLPSKRSKQFRKLKKVAGSVEQLRDTQGPLSLEDYAYFGMNALKRALVRMSMSLPNQALADFQSLITLARQSSGPERSEHMLKLNKAFEDALGSAPAAHQAQLQRTSQQELLRDVMRARAISRKIISKKMELKYEL